MSDIKAVAIEKIRIDGGTQARSELDLETVKEYAEAKKGGSVFPPVTAYYDGSDYWLVDGFHRLAADRRNKAMQVRCLVVRGDRLEARLEASHVNADHGLRRTNADKRAAVNLCLNVLAEMGDEWSESKVAKHCGVSQPLVSEIRSERGERERQTSRVERDAKAQTVCASSEPETAVGSTLEVAVEEPPKPATKPPKNGAEVLGPKRRKELARSHGDLHRFICDEARISGKLIQGTDCDFRTASLALYEEIKPK